jgi:chromosome segregation ATPase
MWKFLTKRADSEGVLAHPMISEMLQRAAAVREGLLDSLDGPLGELAKKLRLATRSEVRLLNRQARELQNQVANLEHQLSVERDRAERAEGGLADAAKQARKLEARARELEEQLAKLQGELAAQVATAAAQPNAGLAAAAGDEKPKKPRGRKKADEAGDDES